MDFRCTIAGAALRAMEEELGRWPGVETGGILLGYAGKDSVSVLEATGGGARAERTPDSFQYDPEELSPLCGQLCFSRQPAMDVVGLWHRHTAPLPFSRADEEMHRRLLELYPHPCLSILFEKDTPRVFLLREDGCTEVTYTIEQGGIPT